MELLIAVVIASFVGSLHCVGMCGPLVAFAVSDPSRRKTGIPSVAPCGLSRRAMLTYALVRALCGLLREAVDHGGTRLGCHRAAALVGRWE